MRRWLPLILCLAAACGRAAGPERATTTTSLPEVSIVEPTTTTTSASSFEVPAEVDRAYVQRVLETIYHLDGEATRRAYASKSIDLEVVARLRAIFAGSRLAKAKEVLAENAVEGFVRFADPPADAFVRVVELIQVTARCMVVRADLDYRPQFKGELSPEPQAVIQLRRFDVLPFNPTGWGVVVAGDHEPGQNLKVCT